MVAAGVEIIFYSFGGGGGDEDGSVFAAFATDDEFSSFEVDLVAIEIAEFGDAEATGKEKFYDGAVAEAGFGVEGDGG